MNNIRVSIKPQKWCNRHRWVVAAAIRYRVDVNQNCNLFIEVCKFKSANEESKQAHEILEKAFSPHTPTARAHWSFAFPLNTFQDYLPDICIVINSQHSFHGNPISILKLEASWVVLKSMHF